MRCGVAEERLHLQEITSQLEAPKRLPRFLKAAQSVRWMFVIALLFRLALASRNTTPYTLAENDHWAFGGEMGHIGRSLAEGQGFANPLYEPTGPTAEVVPVYPFLCAIAMKLFGLFSAGAVFFMLSLNGLFAALTCFPVYWLARRLFDERIAVISGWAWAWFPYSIHLTLDRIWENTLSCMIATFIWWLTCELARSKRLRDWLLWGALWGAQGLSSPAVLGTLPFLGAWLVVRRSKLRLPWLKPALASAIVFLAIAAPWTIRNYEVFHRFIPFRDNFWLELHVGNNGDDSIPEPFASAHPFQNAKEYAQWMKLGEMGFMDAKKTETLNFIREHPGFYVKMVARRILYMWTGFWKKGDLINVLLNGPMTFLMIVGFVYAWRNGKGQDVVPLLIAIIVFPIPYYITHATLAFRHPIDPLITILMCYAVVAWRRAHIAAREPQAVLSGGSAMQV
jgi:4-amino-4-deoxy-L-arabinose transferase-like glycosyltransferase